MQIRHNDDSETVVCENLHTLLKRLPIHRFPIESASIPCNGIYVLFEDGETGHLGQRIVRVGTHTGNNQLPSRLHQHFLNENKDRSIFRKNIGRCLLHGESDPFLEFWEIDLTSRAAREAHRHDVNFELQRKIEKQVTEYIQQHFSFVAFEVSEKEKRLGIESRIISTVSHCDRCRPSEKWLGLHSPKKRIRESGLWQVNELYKTPFSMTEFEGLRTMLL